MKLKKAVTILFFLVAFLRLAVPVAQNWNLFVERFDPAKYKKAYNASQYMIPRSLNPISDETLLSHAGYEYVHGLNPILINSDHPPLGKYLIGLFTVATGNNRTVSLFFAIADLALVGAAVYLLTRSPLLAALGVLFLSFDPMLVDQVIHSPILDIIQVFFLLLYFLLFALWKGGKNRLHLVPLMAVVLGCLSAVKLYFPAIVAIGTTGLTLLLMKKPLKTIAAYTLITLPVAFVTYAASYFRFFMEAKAILPFFGMQKWIFLFWQNNSVNQTKSFGNIIPLVLFNRWKVWWGTEPYISYSGWTVVWPVFFILGLAAAIYIIVRHLHGSLKSPSSPAALFLSIWFAAFTFYLCFLPISPRYLLMLYFPTYILVVLAFSYQFQTKKHAEKNKRSA